MPRRRYSKTPQSLLIFPANLTLRVVGHTRPGFPAEVLAVLKVYLPETTEAAIGVRPSQGGRYLSVTAAVTVHSQAQLDALYLGLRQVEGVITVF